MPILLISYEFYLTEELCVDISQDIYYDPAKTEEGWLSCQEAVYLHQAGLSNMHKRELFQLRPFLRDNI